MRLAVISAFLLVEFCGHAFALDDTAVCANIRGEGGSGLYVAYPQFSPAVAKLGKQATCDVAGGFCRIKPGPGNPFDDGARFYYVPASIPRSEEGVWHIRTQTMARNLDGADQAYLARPAVATRCSPTPPLAFPGGGGFVMTDDYIDHHSGETRGDRDIGRFFHFRIQEPPGGPGCIPTDDARMGNLNGIYGFDGVVRKPRQISSFFRVAPPAQAAPTRYAGLSSEFAYFDRPDQPCFGFAAPKPTRTEYLGASIDWKPYLTKIWIKRLRGREVTTVGGSPLSVSWTP